MAEDQGRSADGDGPDVMTSVDDDRWAPLGSSGALEDMRRTLATFGTRLDSLVTSTTSYRSAITDRLVEYADLVNTLVRNQTDDLGEYQRTNGRLFQDLQRGLADTVDSVGAAVQRVETLLEGGASASGEVVGEVRGLVDAHDRLGRFITEALDEFGARVLGRIDEVHAADSHLLRTVRADAEALVEQLRGVDDRSQYLQQTLDGLREQMAELASGEVVAALWDEVRVVRSELAARGGDDAALARIESLRQELRDGLEVGASGPLDELLAAVDQLATGGVVLELPEELDASLAAIERRIDELATTVASTAISGEASAPADDRLVVEVERLASEVRSLLDQAEVAGVDDETFDERDFEVDDGSFAPDDVAPWSPDAEKLDGLTAAVEAVRDQLDVVTNRLAAQDTGADDAVLDALADLRAVVDGEAGSRSEPDVSQLRAVQDQLRDVSERLDAGLVLDVEVPFEKDVLDALAAMSDSVRTEMDALRRTVLERSASTSTSDDTLDRAALTARFDTLEDMLARIDIPSAAPAADPDEELELELDLTPVVEVLDELRDDLGQLGARQRDHAEVVRSQLRLVAEYLEDRPSAPAAGSDDDGLDGIRKELVALRRRIKLKAEGEALAPAEIEAIAEAVARRLR